MKTKPTTAKTNNIIEITSAAQLQKLVEATIPCEFMLDKQTVRLPVGRMTAHTFEVVRSIRRKAIPKWNPERKMFDEYDPRYLEAVALNEKHARSFIIYSHCPLIAKEQAGLTDPAAIHAHVSKYFTEHILEMISLTIQAGGMERIEEGVDFYLAPRLGKLRGWKPPKQADEPETPGLDRELLWAKVAKAWGKTPQNSGALERDKIEMIGFEMFSEVCESYRAAWREVWRELTKGGKEVPTDMLGAMQAEMGLGRVRTLTERIDHKLGLKNEQPGR